MRFGSMRATLGALAIAVAVTPAPLMAQEEVGDGQPWRDFHAAMDGTTVAFVPMALSFEIAQLYDGIMREHAKALGYNYVVRDPNWSVEGAVQIAEQYVAERPDIMVVHPLDDKAFTRVVRRAQAEGIFVVFVNLRLGTGTDMMGGNAYIGADHYKIGKMKVELAAQMCAHGPSNKIAIIQAPLTNAVGIAETAGMVEALKSHPELELVAQQTAESDANKAKAIASTVLKQHPDLCVILDQWDGQGIGIPPAIQEAGLTEQVKLITSGGGDVVTACDKVADGSYTAHISHNVGNQGLLLKGLIEQVFQSPPAPDAPPFQIYVDAPVITKDTLAGNPCWSLDFLTRELE